MSNQLIWTIFGIFWGNSTSESTYWPTSPINCCLTTLGSAKTYFLNNLSQF